MDKELLSMVEAVKLLGIKLPTLREWVMKRRIEYIKIGRLVKFERKTIEKFIKDNRVPAEKQDK
ncbi:MAG TPA: helix-turn-helix domain-containing protein [archaeon]|nr:helix-turn-helix domain-containing protein [archaeon]